MTEGLGAISFFSTVKQLTMLLQSSVANLRSFAYHDFSFLIFLPLGGYTNVQSALAEKA